MILKKSLFKELYARKRIRYYLDQSYCYILDITKICHQMKNHYLKTNKKTQTNKQTKKHVLNNFILFLIRRKF